MEEGETFTEQWDIRESLLMASTKFCLPTKKEEGKKIHFPCCWLLAAYARCCMRSWGLVLLHLSNDGEANIRRSASSSFFQNDHCVVGKPCCFRTGRGGCSGIFSWILTLIEIYYYLFFNIVQGMSRSDPCFDIFLYGRENSNWENSRRLHGSKI
jgi:hypothetical protein